MIENSGAFKFTPGHPKVGGRRKGTKNQLTTDFIAALCADFRKHGDSVIATMRIEYPADYVKLLAVLVAKWGEQGENVAAQPTTLTVITGVPEGGDAPPQHVNLPVDWRPPPPGRLLPDGRDPFQAHDMSAYQSNSPGNRPSAPSGNTVVPSGGDFRGNEPDLFPRREIDPARDIDPAYAANKQFDGRLTPKQQAEWAEQQPRDEE